MYSVILSKTIDIASNLTALSTCAHTAAILITTPQSQTRAHPRGTQEYISISSTITHLSTTSLSLHSEHLLHYSLPPHPRQIDYNTPKTNSRSTQRHSAIHQHLQYNSHLATTSLPPHSEHLLHYSLPPHPRQIDYNTPKPNSRSSQRHSAIHQHLQYNNPPGNNLTPPTFRTSTPLLPPSLPQTD